MAIPRRRRMLDRSPVSGTGKVAPVKAPWVEPRLECFGDVRTLTLGGSPGVNESNNPFTRFP
jgi:hypothetical protein